jgi:hypothetical protein
MPPAVLVIVIFVPAVIVESVYPVPLPIRICPFVGVVDNAVPPFAIGRTPDIPLVIEPGV